MSAEKLLIVIALGLLLFGGPLLRNLFSSAGETVRELRKLGKGDEDGD